MCKQEITQKENGIRILLGCFLFNFVFSAANLPVNFVSCHPVLEYEIKYVANFVNFSLPRLTTSKRFVLMRLVNLVRSFLHFSEKGTNHPIFSSHH